MSLNSTTPPFLRDALSGEPPADRAALERVWDLLGDAVPLPDAAATDRAWASLRGQIDAPPRLAADRAPIRRTRRRWAAFAMGATAVLALAAVWMLAPMTHRAAVGETAAVALPDGSTVVLAAGSEMSHRRWFRSRDVSLQGEAFFEVEPGTRPFTVATHNANVVVLGTAFNVRAWTGETAVALVHGRVRVDTKPAPGATAGVTAELEPGQAIAVADGALTPVAVDVEREAAWRQGAFSVQDRPLGDVLREVERRYGVAIGSAPRAPLDARVSAFYAEQPALETLLGDLGAAAGARFEAVADGYRVRAVSRTVPPAAPAPSATTAP